jgi:16S rRNA A1518/A1519 N6-dimethyltransferase RsmA/KsgA/DIM1 with predicted DNA glycosylase/AP lyase activity
MVKLFMKKTLPEFETFDFEMNRIMNPNSTYESGLIRVQIYESDSLETILNEDTRDLTVITSIPYSVVSSNLTSLVTGAGLATTYTINFVLEHNIP